MPALEGDVWVERVEEGLDATVEVTTLEVVVSTQ